MQGVNGFLGVLLSFLNFFFDDDNPSSVLDKKVGVKSDSNLFDSVPCAPSLLFSTLGAYLDDDSDLPSVGD